MGIKSNHLLRIVLASLISVALVFTMIPVLNHIGSAKLINKSFIANASPGNPYPQTYTADGIYHPGNCTWQVWEEAYSRLGIKLPSWGNAGGWLEKAQNAGYQVTKSATAIPPANSIMEWSGHVGWIISADSSGATIREGNILMSGSYKAVHQQWWSWSDLKKYRGNPRGFISFSNAPTTAVSYSSTSAEASGEYNAVFYGNISNPGKLQFSSVGISIWDPSGERIIYYEEACTLSTSVVYQSFNVATEGKKNLKAGTAYTYQMWAVAGGNYYYSAIGSYKSPDTTNPVISNVQCTNIDSTGYTITCTVTDNAQINRVLVPTWTTLRGTDSLPSDWRENSKWRATISGNKATFRVNISDHNNERGEYISQIYAFDDAGNYSYVSYALSSIPSPSASNTSPGKTSNNTTSNNTVKPPSSNTSPGKTSNNTVKPPSSNTPDNISRTPQVAKPQTISVVTSYKKTMGAKVFNLGAKASGGGKLSYESSDSKVALISANGDVAITGTGKATITIKASSVSGKYYSASKSVTITVKPKKLTVLRTKAGKKTFTIRWKKDSNATGYQVTYATDRTFKKTVKKVNISSNKTTKRTIKNLKKGKTYYVKVRSYKKVGKSKIYSEYSKPRTVKVK